MRWRSSTVPLDRCSRPDSPIGAPTDRMAEAGLAHAADLLAQHAGRGAPPRERPLLTRRRTQPARTSSVHTLKLVKVLGPNVLLIATSDASRPRAIKTLPMRGVLLRASKMCQCPPRNASNQAAKSMGPYGGGTPR